MRSIPAFMLALLLVALASGLWLLGPAPTAAPPGRREVVFWHFWGGRDRDVVEQVVARFNASQSEHYVRAVAMPGNNLDVKLFLAVTGGQPPDLVNQDDPIVADWAARGAIVPIDELAGEEEAEQLADWLYPAARRLAEYDQRLYAVPNGLDIRALYYNKTQLDEAGQAPPQSLADLDEIALRLTVVDEGGRLQRAGFLPNPDRLWAWGFVFGGDFYDAETGDVTADDEENVAALAWMASYSRRYGPREVAKFRPGGQSLPGKTFPLLPAGDESPHGPYATIMDGQWRTRDIEAGQADRRRRGLPVAEYGVAPLPFPPGGRKSAGWVNGNVFVVPRGAENPAGAWEFMKFWIGYGQSEAEAAVTCAAGGWIPVSPSVAGQPAFQSHLKRHPLFAEFVALAASENQFPIPVIPGAPLFNREIMSAGSEAMEHPDKSPRQILGDADRRIEGKLKRNGKL